MSYTIFARGETESRASLRKSASKPTASALRVGDANDACEQEADRVASAVISGHRAPSWSISNTKLGAVQRQPRGGGAGDQSASKPNNYDEAAKKIGEAFLKTDVGKKLTDAVKSDPLVKGAEGFMDTLPGKIIAGAAAVGAVSALAATHTPLPAQIPDIPLDGIKPGLSVKITYEGPVDHPTKAGLTFSYTPKGEKKKPKETESERYRSETARIAADQEKFRAGMHYKPGSPQDVEQKQEQKAVDDYVAHRFGMLPGTGGQPLTPTYPGLKESPATGLRSPMFESPFKPKPIHLLDRQLELKPLTSANAPSEADEKEETTPVQRKAGSGASTPEEVPTLAWRAANSPGLPLEPRTQQVMESKFEADFSAVRVHTDSKAADSAKVLNARAYTLGGDITFAAGEYSPATTQGRKLLVHELTHVIQQSGSSGSSAQVAGSKREAGCAAQEPTERRRSGETASLAHIVRDSLPGTVSASPAHDSRQRGAERTSLRVSQPGDADERQAEAAVRAVQSGAAIPTLGPSSAHIARQPKTNQGAAAKDEAPVDTFAGAEVSQITIWLGQKRVGFQTSRGLILGTVDTDLTEGSYELKPEVRHRQWVITKPAVHTGRRFKVDLEGAIPWTLSYPATLPLTVTSGPAMEVPDPHGMGYNTIYKNAGPTSKAAVLALASLETPSMFVDLEEYKKLEASVRKSILALEPHAAGTGCADWFDVMRANDPDFKTKHTPEQISAGDLAYYESMREARLGKKVEAAKADVPTLDADKVEATWNDNHYGLIALAQTPNHGIKAEALHQIWLKYWADKVAIADSTLSSIIANELRDHVDLSETVTYRKAKAVNDLGLYLIAGGVDALEICRFEDAVGKSLTLDELTKRVISHLNFREGMAMFALALTFTATARPSLGPRYEELDSVKTEPIKTEPIKTEPVKTEPIRTESVKTDAAMTGGQGSLKASGRTTPGGAGSKSASARALAESEATAASGEPLPATQQQIAKDLQGEHPFLNPQVAKEAARGGASAAGKGGKGADVPLINGGGREVSVHQASSPFTADSLGGHLQQEAMQSGTTEIYLQVNSTGATRAEFLKILPQIRNAYLELRGVTVKVFGADGQVWWSGQFGGPK